MDNSKIENILNLALNSTTEEREKSDNLNVGYNAAENTWEVIVKYNGDISRLQSEVIQVEELLAGYAIITLPEGLIDSLAELNEIEYIEKPKRLFFSVIAGKEASCILPVTEGMEGLTGRGCLIGIIDSGIDYANLDFRTRTGESRILYLWDQVLAEEYTKQQIDEALAAPTREQQQTLVPSVDISGHGTAVAGIAAGNGNGSDGRFSGVAPESELIVVKLGQPREGGFPRTTELMRAITYVIRKALELERPVVVNLSFGNTYGAHDGTSLLERFLDNVSEIGRSVVCVGSGNEAASAGHYAGTFVPGAQVRQIVELAVANYETTVNVQLWKNYADIFLIEVVAPSGERRQIPVKTSGRYTFTADNTQLLIYVGEPVPYSVNQEIYIDFLPENIYVASGVWRFELIPHDIRVGVYTFYLPSSSVRNVQTRFYGPMPEATLTIPSTARRVITVGAYDTTYDSYADFSGRGYADTNQLAQTFLQLEVKPDLAAPGVGIVTTAVGGGYEAVTGTSFATPFVTGAAALMMEWGIVRGNDPFLYGEKVKAYLRRGAKRIRGESEYPNSRVGFGALCLEESLPVVFF
ncbi:MAG: S8 family serine peptidase [Lachnospiraceae bacterium]|nr:S8 family serine peptidase [Lachnospiraceae bacterium]